MSVGDTASERGVVSRAPVSTKQLSSFRACVEVLLPPDTASACALKQGLLLSCVMHTFVSTGIPQRLGSGFLSRGRKESGQVAVPMMALLTGEEVVVGPQKGRQAGLNWGAKGGILLKRERCPTYTRTMGVLTAAAVVLRMPADDPDQPVRPRLRAGLSTLQRSSAAAAAAATAAVGSSTAFTSSPAPAVTTAASPAQLPPAAARPGAAVQMVQLSPLPGEGVCMWWPQVLVASVGALVFIRLLPFSFTCL